MDEKKLSSYGDFIAKIGFPVAVGLVLVALVVWLIYNQITNTDKLIADDTKAKVEMTTAIRSLENTSLQMSSSLKSMEMETSKRLDRIEMTLGKD